MDRMPDRSEILILGLYHLGAALGADTAPVVTVTVTDMGQLMTRCLLVFPFEISF